MKIIQFLINKFFAGGIIIISIATGLMAMLLLLHIFFEFSGNRFLRNLSLDYQQGIAVPLDFHSAAGSDTSWLEVSKYGNDLNTNIFNSNGAGKPVLVSYRFGENKSKEAVIYRDSIYPVFKTSYLHSNRQDDWKSVNKIKFEKGIAFIKPASFKERVYFIIPHFLFYLTASFFCLQLALFLNSLQSQIIFTKRNYQRLLSLGIALIFYQLLLYLLHHFQEQFYVTLDYKSTIPNYRSPFFLMGEPYFHIEWGYIFTGCIILFIARVFFNGYQLQNEQDLTI
jgi:hypothetical protein